MKQSMQCPKCDSLRVGYLETVPDHDDSGPGQPEAQSIGFAPRPGKAPWGTADIHWVQHFLVEAYLCADCGYVETYVRSPRAVPYDQLKGFHWINPQAPEEGPYL